MWWSIIGGLVAIGLVMGLVMLWGLHGRLPDKLPFLSRGQRDSKGQAIAETEKREPTFNTGTVQAAVPVTLPEFELPSLPSLPNEWQEIFCYIVRFYEEGASEARRFEALKEQLRRREVKIFQLLGFDEHGQQWQSADFLAAYRYWILMIPLADRSGSLSAQRLKLLQDDCRRFAAKLRQRVEFPDLKGVLERVKMLDAFCNEADIVLRLRIVLPESLNLDAAAELLERAYMVADEKGRHVYRLNSEIMFTAEAEKLPNNTVQELSFILDAPKVSDPLRAFESMIQSMQEIAELKQGRLTDRNNNELTDTDIGMMRGSIAQLAENMKEQGVPPGSMLAHLLFS